MKKYSAVFLMIIFVMSVDAEPLIAQEHPDPKSAFLRSLIMPGWGHYYADKEDWTRGQLHLVAEVGFMAAYFGFYLRSSNLEQQYITLGHLRAGVDVAGRNRAFRLAVGDFSNLEEYNDYQRRSRNWHRLYDDIPENRWNWRDDSDRSRYRGLREDSDRMKNQLPAMLSLMVVNRVISGISAHRRAKNKVETPAMSVTPVYGGTGFTANLRWNF